MKIEILKDPKATVVQLSGRLNAANVTILEDELQKQLKEGALRLIIDLEGLEYVSSAGLRVFLLIGKQITEAGSYMALARLNSGIEQVFKISGFLSLFNVFDSIEEALKAPQPH